MQSTPTAEENLNDFNLLQQNRYEVQENAVFIDFSQTALQDSISNFKTLNIYQRTALAKNIHSVKQALKEQPNRFTEFLSLLAHDCEANQAELVEYLEELLKGELDTESRKELISPLRALIQGAHLEMKEKGCIMLVSLVRTFTGQERRPLEQFAKELLGSQEEDIRITGLQLTAELTAFLSKKEAQECFSHTLRPIYESATLRLKKELIASCAIIGKHVSPDFFSLEIVKHFLAEHCREPAMGIRKSCAEVLPHLIELAHTEKSGLASLLLGLTKDGHKVVRLTACKAVPEFLGKYGGGELPETLLKFYLDLPDHEINKIVNRQNEVMHPVAFYFTAILQQLGKAAWPRLCVLFNKLLFLKHNEVTLPLASSLHEIAKVIGPEYSHEYLFPAFNNIFKAGCDELKLVALEHFSHFVSIFGSAMRENLIDVFMVLQKNPKKWRIRLAIAKQLSTISRNYEAETLFRYILPITLKLANDPVSAVREQAARHMHEVISGMSKDPAYENIAQESLKGFGLSEQYIQRETFARMVVTLHFLHDFREKYYGIVLQLANDPILIVRLALALSIKEILRDYPNKREGFAPIVAILLKEEEVRDIFE